MSNSMEQSRSLEVTVAQLMVIFLAFYGILRSIAMFTKPITGPHSEPD
jgi:hypothetical protein